jgi:hypothetical protein
MERVFKKVKHPFFLVKEMGRGPRIKRGWVFASRAAL